jgi:hypothetical protein
VDSPVSFLTFKGTVSVVPQFSMMLALGSSYIACIVLRNILSIPSFFRAFIMKGCWILSKAFSASVERIVWFLFLLLFICCSTFMDLCMLNYPCIPGMEPT